MALVVMGHASPPGPASCGKRRLGPVEGLDLALLVDAQHDGLVGRVEVEAHDVGQLLGEARVAAELEVRTRWGARPWASQIRWTVAGLTPWAAAIVRQLQWVAPGGVVWSVASTMALMRSALDRRLAAPSRGRLGQRRRAAVGEAGPPQDDRRAADAELVGDAVVGGARARPSG